MSLNHKQQLFVQEYCKDFNATQAAIRAGFSEKAAGQIGHEQLKKHEIQAAIDEYKEKIATLAEIDAAWVLKQWKQIATADANDLMQLRRGCCRHCYGIGHAYQWTEAEFLAVQNKCIELGKEPPDSSGGMGFDVNAEINPDCPECGGLGQELVHFEDTRKLKGAARRLYAGVQKTKDGIKILTRDQDSALLNIAKYIGMLVEKKEISGPNGGPVSMSHITADDLTDDQLAAILKVDEQD